MVYNCAVDKKEEKKIMSKRILAVVLFIAFAFTVSYADEAASFQGPGCAGKCSDCHSMTKEEASKLLKTDKFKAQIKDVREAPVKGLWEVEVTQSGKNIIVYIDYAKKYLVEGVFTPVEKIGESAPLKKIDIKKIPLDNALVFGNPKAEKRIIIFDDPDCPYCIKLHEEVKKIIGKRKDVAFYVKLFPLPIHPKAYEKSKAIVCKKSPKLLEDAFAGKNIPAADCETNEVDKNLKLGEELGIRGTPAVIFPDGRLLPGYVPAEALLNFLDTPQ